MSDYKFKPDPNDHELIAFMENQGLDTGLSKPQVVKISQQDAPKANLEKQFIKQLVITRLDQKMSQTVLAQKASTPQSALARIEAGKGNPTLKTLAKLADAMGYQLTLLRKQD